MVTQGLYFIYSQVGVIYPVDYHQGCEGTQASFLALVLQVLYKDPTWVMGHVITKRLKGAETKLMKCLKSMPSNVSVPLNTCYTAGEASLTRS